MATRNITRDRIARMFRVCKSPSAASHAADLVFKLARRQSAQARQLYALADALHEQRHVLLCMRRDDLEAAAAHSRNVGECITRACGGAS